MKLEILRSNLRVVWTGQNAKIHAKIVRVYGTRNPWQFLKNTYRYPARTTENRNTYNENEIYKEMKKKKDIDKLYYSPIPYELEFVFLTTV